MLVLTDYEGADRLGVRRAPATASAATLGVGDGSVVEHRGTVICLVITCAVRRSSYTVPLGATLPTGGEAKVATAKTVWEVFLIPAA